ncbi:MAG: hypothetical protein ACR2KL_13620 [Nocardioidaceae bacterium]
MPPTASRARGRMHPRARAQRLEMLVGILGFFTAAAFGTAVVAEVRGQNAVLEALVLLAFVVALSFAIRAWRRAG